MSLIVTDVSNYIITALLIINMICLLQINNLKNSMDNYYQQIVSGINRNSNEISNIYSNINSILEKQSSLLDSYEIEFGDSLDKDNLTVPVKFTVVPKEYSEGLTVNIQLNDESIMLNKKGTSFETTVDIDIFGTFQPKVVISQDGIQKTESLDEYYDLYNKFLLQLDGHYNGSINYKYVVLRNEVDKNGEPVFNSPEWSNGSVVEITRNGKVLNVPNYKY